MHVYDEHTVLYYITIISTVCTVKLNLIMCITFCKVFI